MINSCDSSIQTKNPTVALLCDLKEKAKNDCDNLKQTLQNAIEKASNVVNKMEVKPNRSFVVQAVPLGNESNVSHCTAGKALENVAKKAQDKASDIRDTLTHHVNTATDAINNRIKEVSETAADTLEKTAKAVKGESTAEVATLGSQLDNVATTIQTTPLPTTGVSSTKASDTSSNTVAHTVNTAVREASSESKTALDHIKDLFGGRRRSRRKLRRKKKTRRHLRRKKKQTRYRRKRRRRGTKKY